MTTADHIARVLRSSAPQQKFLQAEVTLINQLAALWDARRAASRSVPSADPLWIAYARARLGEKEVPGPKHNPWIIGFWQKLGAPWIKTDDDTGPWCGGFVAWALNEAGLSYPKEFPRAASFREYGTACPAQLGAIGVKSRKGGNHVFFIVGITPDGKFYKALGGNQRNMVSIVDIPVGDVDAIRWPTGVAIPPRPAVYLPVLAAGTLTGSEA